MNNFTDLQQPIVSIVNHQPMTTSINVAARFEKRHKNVLQAIETLECSAEFRRLNFQPTLIDVQMPRGGHRKAKAVGMTRNGFTMISFGFTGKEAVRFKEAYIKAFDLMEEELRSQANINFLPAPADTSVLQQSAREDGFVRGLRFMMTVKNLRDAIDMDEQTLQNLCWFRSLGLTQDEAARLCIVSKRECERVEETLRAFGVKTPVINMSIRKKQTFDHWTELVVQAGVAALPGKQAVARIAEVAHA